MKDKQKLIDLMFEIGITIKVSPALQEKSIPELTVWIRKQLDMCGFHTEPCGSSWGVLK